METRSGFVADKVAMKESDGGLGLKLQRTESLPYKMTMHHRRPFSISESGGGGGGGGSSGGGPTFYNGCEEGCRLMSDIYDVVGGAGSIARTLQPFNTSAFKSPGAMAASLRFPFTSAQLQELERQALIYKYMMASVPVPPDLLIPISRSLTDSAISHSNLGRSSSFNLRFSNSTDPEPGRCRRTDGKKWRCSRDVAPDQKYCERHMHRGRPRSRKPVEVHSEIKDNTRSVPHTTTTAATASVSGLTTNTSRTSSHHLGATKPYPFGLFSKPDYKASPFETMVSASSYKDSSMNWMMKGETVPLAASNQQVQQLMHSRLEMNNTKDPVFQNCYEESLNLNSFEGFSSRDGLEVQRQNDQCCLFLNPELALEVPLSSNERQTPKHFIDAWSTAASDHTSDITGNKSSVSSNGKLPLSSLTLSMSDGSDNMDQIQMGLGVIDSDRDNNGVVKPQPLSWMTPVSWMTSPPGGPLGEVLQSSNTTAAAAGSNATSPRGCSSSISRGSSGGAGSGGGGGLNFIYDGWGGGSSGEVGTPRATNVSSPSGVLQKTLASLSDSSGGSSPTFNAASAAAKSEIALQWLNHSKLPSSS